MGRGAGRFALDHDACGVGFIAQLGGSGSHEIVERALEALRRLEHRGGLDADGRSGDGAGLLTAIPKAFFCVEAGKCGITLPATFALGMIFLPRGEEETSRAVIANAAKAHELEVLGWRKVPVDESVIGQRAADTAPVVEQCFLSGSARDLELRLFRMRKAAEAMTSAYFCSLSSRTIVYKGLLTPEQLPAFYSDLAHAAFVSPFAIFHQRYSTNTQPSWSLAQPFRYAAHNGEINTIRSNRRWFRAREGQFRSELGVETTLLEEHVSDSATFDNALEVALRRGRDLPVALLSMVPQVSNDDRRTRTLHQYLDARAFEQEPWDGPAALVFSDGITVGAKLDRNGLRPLRYTLTSDGLLVVGSETGIADLHDKKIVERSRLGPGDLLLANPATGELTRPNDIAARLKLPRRRRAIVCDAAPSKSPAVTTSSTRVMSAFGWTQDQFRLLFRPLAIEGKDGVWSMGDDAPPAALSAQPRALWDYCKQRFAQVTNPPIDSLREAHVMSLQLNCAGRVVLPSPVLHREQLLALERRCAPARVVDTTFETSGGLEGAMHALRTIREEARTALADGSGMLVISDRALSGSRASVPILLATAAVWQEVEEAGQWRLPLVIETGEAFDTHHLALLIACGASAVLPYIALEQAGAVAPDGVAKYRAAIHAGLLKVLARMGISTLASYRNSQLFETVGLDRSVSEEFFPDADAALGGKTLVELLEDVLRRHAAAFSASTHDLRDAGMYRFRKEGEQHASSPEFVRRLQALVKSPTQARQRILNELADTREPTAVRDLLEVASGEPIPLDQVESETSILGLFSTQAMSLGAISPEAHRTLPIAMNRLGARSNTGEGGEHPDVYRNQPEAANRVKQVASGRFGVTAEYLVSADELEIKIAQGAKPGEGGQLPAGKVTPYIASLRHAAPNMALISPPPHHDIYSIEDLAQLIYDLRAINPVARIGVKLVSSAGVGIIAAGVAKAGADVITISGHDGGTGASPLTSIKNTGLPWEAGLRDAHQTLTRAGLRGRVRLRVDGGLKFARDVIVAACLGAEEFGFGTAALIAIGCVMARQCHLNTCPVGIATQDEKLRVRFAGTPEMVENYFRSLAQEIRRQLAELGVSALADIVGDVSRLRPRTGAAQHAVCDLLQAIPRQPTIPLRAAATGRLARRLNAAYADGGPLKITNEDRAIGAHLSGEVIRRRFSGETPGPATFDFAGVAGQSFGAFLTSGVTFRLSGEANDYVGKGLSGGTIAISGGEEASGRGDILTGNTVLYGATSGELYVAGRAGERFAVRNSGAIAVVEGVGQHGCEYMTAGVVIVMGGAGANFGAGMTGGLAYVLNDVKESGINPQSVRLSRMDSSEEAGIRLLLRRHLRFTGSPLAARLLLQAAPLPLRRVEPLQAALSVAEVWSPVLQRVCEQQCPAPLPVESPREEPAIQ